MSPVVVSKEFSPVESLKNNPRLKDLSDSGTFLDNVDSVVELPEKGSNELYSVFADELIPPFLQVAGATEFTPIVRKGTETAGKAVRHLREALVSRSRADYRHKLRQFAMFCISELKDDPPAV